MNAPSIAQAKAALNRNLAVTQSKLAKCTADRDEARSRIQIAEDRAEMADRSARDVARDRDQWRARATKAEEALGLLAASLVDQKTAP